MARTVTVETSIYWDGDEETEQDAFCVDLEIEFAISGEYLPAKLSGLPEDCYPAVYNDAIDKIQDRKLLLDHILISPALRGRVAHAEIAHEECEAATDHNAEGRQRYVSDHRPVLVEINVLVEIK